MGAYRVPSYSEQAPPYPPLTANRKPDTLYAYPTRYDYSLQVKDGRWGYTKVPVVPEEHRDLLGADVYGRMRSPWNVLDREYLTRGLGEMCGLSSTDFCEFGLVSPIHAWSGHICRERRKYNMALFFCTHGRFDADLPNAVRIPTTPHPACLNPKMFSKAYGIRVRERANSPLVRNGVDFYCKE